MFFKGRRTLSHDEQKLSDRVKYLEALTEYLESELSRLSSMLRYVSAPIINDLPFAKQCKDSFDFQWDKLPKGRWNLENDKFRQEAPGLVCQYTGLPPAWFKGKKVIDVGSGAGRYSWALCKLGAHVTSIDQSAHGLEKTKKACSEFKGHRAMCVDLLKPLEINETFDLVWCFGVLHHTGDTYGAFKKIAPLVSPGGYLFLMLYGEPRSGMMGDYEAVTEYDYWRKATYNMTLNERLKVVKEAMGEGKFKACGEEYVEGYFDAISPAINDLYTFEEIERWLLMDGFIDIKRTVDTRNNHIIARRG
jgi:2-polyprenyl-3-methyl-5-hydroxy-6-metoxy-1,4-benzoquinol methylase